MLIEKIRKIKAVLLLVYRIAAFFAFLAVTFLIIGEIGYIMVFDDGIAAVFALRDMTGIVKLRVFQIVPKADPYKLAHSAGECAFVVFIKNI